MNKYEINDIRMIKDFRGKSFSGYKLSEAKSLLSKGITMGNMEEGYYWMMEIFCAGHIECMWEVLIVTAVSNIGLLNPKLCIYLDIKRNNFDEIYKNGYHGADLLLRNNESCRLLLCELVIVLCASPKQLIKENMKVIEESDFDIEKLSRNLAAKDDGYLEEIYKEDDPLELFIGFNELAYSLSVANKSRNLWKSMYWFDWILKYEKYLKDGGKRVQGNYRNVEVDQLFRKDIIWIVWDILIKHSKVDKLVEKIIRSLFRLFCKNYKVGMKQKYRGLICMCIQLVLEYKIIDLTVPIIENKSLITHEEEIRNEIFSRIKSSELSPNTEYLFNNIEGRSEAEKRVEKLRKMQNIMN